MRKRFLLSTYIFEQFKCNIKESLDKSLLYASDYNFEKKSTETLSLSIKLFTNMHFLNISLAKRSKSKDFLSYNNLALLFF